MREDKGRVLNVEYSSDGIAKTIKKYVENGQSAYSDWFILTRRNSELEEIIRVLEKYNIPSVTFKKA